MRVEEGTSQHVVVGRLGRRVAEFEPWRLPRTLLALVVEVGRQLEVELDSGINSRGQVQPEQPAMASIPISSAIDCVLSSFEFFRRTGGCVGGARLGCPKLIPPRLLEVCK